MFTYLNIGLNVLFLLYKNDTSYIYMHTSTFFYRMEIYPSKLVSLSIIAYNGGMAFHGIPWHGTLI